MTAVPAYAGVPLTDKTHREVAVVNCSEAKIDWSAYADDRTLVLLSAVGTIDATSPRPWSRPAAARRPRSR